MNAEERRSCLEPTTSIECDHPRIRELAQRLGEGARNVNETTVRLFEYARDTVAYSPYCPFYLEDHYRATVTLDRGKGFCVQKAILLAALARAAGIPSRLVLADIRNYLAPEHIIRSLGTDLMVCHCYTELRLGDRWVGLTPAFDSGLCDEYGLSVVKFDGVRDAIFPVEDEKGRRFVEYVRYHGRYADLPLDFLLGSWTEAYGEEWVEAWRMSFEG